MVQEEYKVTSKDVFSGLNAHFFDNSVFDIYGSLFNGASLVAINKDDLKNPSFAIDKLESAKITIWFSVPHL